MYKALLISSINWDSLSEIPAVLKKGGCNVTVFCSRNSWVLKNKYLDHWVEAPIEMKTFIEQLIEHIETNADNYQWIIPGDDIVIRALNDRINNDRLFYKILPLTKIENRDMLGSKAGFSNLCTKYNIKTPRYLVYEPGLQPETVKNILGYPFLMKIDKSEGGFGIFLCNNENDYISNLSKINDKHNLVLQEFVKGWEVNVEVLFKDGHLIAYSHSKRLKCIGDFGVSTQRAYFSDPTIEATVQKIGRDLGLNGFANVVFMYDEKAKTHLLIEVDVRPNSWMYYSRFLGADFAKGVKKIISGDLTLLRPSFKDEEKATIIWLYKKDLYRCLVHKDFKGLRHWLTNKHQCWRYIPFYDRKLLFACNKYLWKTFTDLLQNKLARKKIELTTQQFADPAL